MDHVFFSLIIPVYNVSSFLNDCINSVLSQSFVVYEIILVNDGSTDDSGLICQEYANKFSFVKYYNKKNGGLSSARNYGANEAIGDYLLFIDSDDFLVKKDFLENSAAIIKFAKPDVLMTLPIEYNEFANDIIKTHQSKHLPINRILEARTILDDLYSFENPHITMAQTKIIRREFFFENDLFFTDGIYHEDDDWIVRFLFCNPKIFISNMAGYGYRHRRNSIISSVNEEKKYKKCLDKVKIAEKSTLIAYAYGCRNCLTYFIYYFIAAVRDMKKNKYLNDFRSKIKQSNIVDMMRFSNRKKHRLLFLLSKLLGKGAVYSIILKT